MITSIVTFLMKRRPLVLFMVLCFLGTGYMTFRRLNIEAYPDPSPPIIELIAQPSGQSAEEVERLFTIPIEVQMAGMPGLLFCRSQSLVGLSDIRLQFSYETPYKSALQEVINRLSLLAPLPSGVVPQISPESAVGEIFRYQLSGPPGYSLTELKSLQDWVLTRRFKTVPGVRDAVVVGIPHERFGEEIVAVVELERGTPGDPVTDEVVIEHVKARLAGYKAPRRVRFVPTIGRSPAGKVDYARHRGETAEWSGVPLG